MAHKTPFILVPSSHWDREWYLSYRRVQARLLRLMNKVLTLTAENDDYSFLLDGQTIPLEDYLAIYPEREDLLKQRIREGRIVPGPWYTVPDTAIPCGEGLIHNLREGQELCRRFGGGLNTAYTPDSFGLASQMPQLYKLFGFERAFFMRGGWAGADAPNTEPPLMHWSGADGTCLPTLCTTYSDGLGLTRDRIWSSFDRVAMSYEACKSSFEALLAHQSRLWKSKVHFAVVGIDHMEPTRELPQHIKQLQVDFPDYDIHLGTMDEFFDLLVREDPALFVPVTGEQRGNPDRSFPLENTLSTRMDLKDSLRRAENRLQYICGPLAAFCPVTDSFEDIDTDPFCRQAWKLLAACQAHDSICMCNTDPTNRDVGRRLDHAEQMSREAEKTLQQRLGESIVPAQSAAALVVYNPLPFARSARVKGCAVVPCAAPGMRLVTADGTPVPGAVLKETYRKRRDIETMKYNEYDEIRRDTTRYQLIPMQDHDWYTGLEYEFDAVDLPACGYRTYYLTVGENLTAENAAPTLTVRTDGDMFVFEKDGQTLYTLHFEDESDCGDSYTFLPEGDRQVVSANGAAVCSEENGRTVLRRRFILVRPDGEVRLNAAVTLLPGSDRPDLDIAIENGAADHRLRMVVTLPQCADECFGDTAFDLTHRPVFAENPDAAHVRTRAMRNAAGVFAKDTLAVFSAGARECEVTAIAGGTRAAFTLLRSVGRTMRIHDDASGGVGTRWWTGDSKMLGRYTTRCGIALYPGRPADLTIQNDALAWQLPPSVYGTWAHGSASPEAGFLTVENAVFSTVEARENGMAVRVFAAKEGGNARLTFAAPVRTARLVDLRGEPMAGDITADGCTVSVPLAPCRIATVEVGF